jgi:ferredoxin, 2Fe-2S
MPSESLHIIVHTPDGARHTLPALAGWRIMEIIRDGGLPIRAECGGCMACATCHVYVDPAWVDKLNPPRDDERDMIADFARDPRENSRLSCQILMSDELNGLVVTLAPDPD